MIKAVIFDFGGVLVNDIVPMMMDHYANYFGVSRDKFRAALKLHNKEWQQGKIDEATLWGKISNSLKKNKIPTDGFWIEGFKRNVTPNKKMLQLVKDLKTNGYNLALLSNTEVQVMDFIRTFLESEHPHFHHFVFSCAIGMVKPDKEIYEHTLGLMGIKSHEAVFTDDRLENVLGARKVGMHAIHFQHHKQFRIKLDKILEKNR